MTVSKLFIAVTTQFEKPPADEWLHPDDSDEYPDELYIRAGGDAGATADTFIEQFED